MRRGLLLFPHLVWCATIASAQAPPRPDLPARLEQLLLVNGVHSTTTGTSASADDVITRMLSFDRDNDGRVTKAELPERMQGILPRGDTDRDDALDLTEIRMLTRQPAEFTVRGFPQQHGGYGFADEGTVSSLPHIQGALEDLRLASATRDKALPLVTAFGQALDADAANELLKAMQPLLTDEQLVDFKSALDSRNARRFMVNLGRSGAGGPTQVFMAAPSLARRIAAYRLTAGQSEQALTAIEHHKERLRPGDEDRAALLDQMNGILSDEERDDFRAALERRPIVKSGPGGLVTGVVGESVRPVPPSVTFGLDAPLVRPAILIER